MYTYSIMPLSEEHFEQTCADVRDQFERGISSCPLFKMTLVPEGDPVWDKVTPMCASYRRYREALAPHGIKTGVLVQASMGHGYLITPNPFDRYVNLVDGKEEFVCCPEDERFLTHFEGVLETIAAEHPDAIMLDDDFRMVMRPGRGCACPRHMALFCERTGVSMTREQLYDHIRSHGRSDPLTRAFLELQRDSLIKAATRFRAAIDRVDPSIQGINCTSGDSCESVVYTSKIFAGKGNPVIVRAANGTYAPPSDKRFSITMRNAAVRGAKLKAHGVDVVLAETDTVPFNRYAKSARYLHAHYTASILEGLKGAKHWITRLTAHEPASGKAFREILAQHNGLYEQLSKLSDSLEWVGCGLMFAEQEYADIHLENTRYYHENEWAGCVLERMGLPFYFTQSGGKASFLEAGIVRDLSEDTLRSIFAHGSVFADGESAADLCARGLGDLLGVSVSPWESGLVSGEFFSFDPGSYCSKQKNLRRLTLQNGKVEALSHCFRNERNKFVPLAPAVTCLEREGGRLSVVYCGSPKAEFHYTEGFAFLNESRKRQFISLLKRAGALPVYCEGDNEICLRAGYLGDGRLLAAIFPLGYDPADTLDLYLERDPTSITLLSPSGTEAPVQFEKTGDLWRLAVRTEPLYPKVLLIR